MRCIVILSLLLLAVGAACAAEEPAPAAAPTISVDFTDVDMSQALATLSEKAQITVLADPGIKGKVTCSLSEVQPEQALSFICKLNKLMWFKTYAGAGAGAETVNATKLIALMDALKALGGASLVWEDPASGSATVYAQSKFEAGKVPALAAQLNLKPVYLVRMEPDPNAEAAKAAKAQEGPKTVQSIGVMMPPSDPQAAAQEVWGYFNQMSPDQRNQVMHDLRHMMYENLTPEQREAMRRQFDQFRGRRGDGQRDGRQPGPRPPGAPQGTAPPGGHSHQ